MGRKKQNLPKGWKYTGRTLYYNLFNDGIKNRFYDLSNSPHITKGVIYQVIGRIEIPLQVKAKFVDLKNPNRPREIDIVGKLQKEEVFLLRDILRDKEVIFEPSESSNI